MQILSAPVFTMWLIFLVSCTIAHYTDNDLADIVAEHTFAAACVLSVLLSFCGVVGVK